MTDKMVKLNPTIVVSILMKRQKYTEVISIIEKYQTALFMKHALKYENIIGLQ